MNSGFPDRAENSENPKPREKASRWHGKYPPFPRKRESSANRARNAHIAETGGRPCLHRLFLRRSAKRALYMLDSCFPACVKTVSASFFSAIPGLFFCHSGESRNPSFSCALGIAKEREARTLFAGFPPLFKPGAGSAREWRSVPCHWEVFSRGFGFSEFLHGLFRRNGGVGFIRWMPAEFLRGLLRRNDVAQGSNDIRERGGRRATMAGEGTSQRNGNRP